MDMMQNPCGETILTIAIPTYNGAGTLQETLKSVVTQLQPGVDILISDNASTDGVVDIIRNYQTSYPQIHYRCNSENVGADRNFDLAIRLAPGKFVWLFSDDDLMEPGAIKYVLDVLTRHPDLGAIFVNYAVYSPDNKCIDPRAWKVEDEYFKDGEMFLSIVSVAPIFCSSNVVRRSLWEFSDSNRFIGTNWVHYGVITSVVRDTAAYCISHPYVRLISRAAWDTKGQLFKNTITLANIINHLPKYGYGSSVTRMVLGVIAKGLPMTAIAAKRDGIEITWIIIRSILCEFFRSFPIYSVISIVFLTLPNSLYAFAYKLYKKK